MKNSFFQKLNPKEEQKFRQQARKDYKPGTPVTVTWHPAYRAECELMNLEQNREVGAKE